MASSFAATVFPKVESLVRANEEVAIGEALQGKEVIGLYFSASWCGPCRRFTPQLVEAYETLKHTVGKEFEIVFISSDSDLDEFNQYYSKMPWLALPYEEFREMAEELGEKYECQGIPHLVLLDGKTGEIITKDGRTCISEHGPSVFPWSEEAIQAAQALKNAKICQVFNSWSLFPTEISTSLLASPAEAVVVMIGSAEGPAQHVAPRLHMAYKALGSSKLRVVFVPTKQGVEEETLHSTFPGEWFVIKEASTLSIISSTMGTKIDELDSLMVFNGQGSVMYNPDASRLVYQLKECMFPWKVGALESYKKDNFNQPGLKFLSDARLVSKDASGGVTLVEDGRSASDILMNNDLVGLYFSAHWCGPCRGFTPVFAEMYNQLKASGKKVEVIFLSSDRDQEAFESYFTTDMPWLAVDYAQRELKEMLSMALEVRGIPTLVWVNPKTGEMMMNGRETVNAGANYFPWTKELMEIGRIEMKERDAKKIGRSQKTSSDGGTIIS